MSTRSTDVRRVIATITILLAASLALAGCAHEKEYEDEKGKTTGEVEVSKHETEYEVEKDLPKDETRAEVEKEYETEHGEVEVRVENGEAEIEGELEYPDGNNPAYDGGTGEENVELKLSEPDPKTAIVVSTVYSAPADFIGTTVVGEANVKKVISDRGFWVNYNGERIFAVVREDMPAHEMIDIDKGQHLKFGGVLVDGDDWKHLAGKLEPETKEALQSQNYFLAVSWDDVQIVDNAAKEQASK